MRKPLITFLYPAVLALGIFAAYTAVADEGPKTPALSTVLNKKCGFWLKYPKGSQLEHPEDCALKMIPPASFWPDWVAEATLTLYTAPVSQEELGTTPPGEPNEEPSGFIRAGGMKFNKTIYGDAAMSHQMITVVYEGAGKYRKYRFEGYLNARNPEVMGEKAKDWDPQKLAVETFDSLVSTFRPLVPTDK